MQNSYRGSFQSKKVENFAIDVGAVFWESLL